MRNKGWSFGFGAALAAGMLCMFPVTVGAAPVLPEGISAAGQSLAGQTCDEAEKTIEDYIDSLGGQKITLAVDGQEVSSTARELGFAWANEDALKQELLTYAGGSLIKQYMTHKDLTQTPVELTFDTSVDSTKVKDFIDTQCSTALTQARDASIIRENGQFVITESETGKIVDAKATEEALNAALAAGLESPIQVAAVVTEQQPAISSESLASIQDVLGTYTTDFSSSGAARSTNLAVGAQKINGHLLMPGEELSGYECLQPFTTANGYKTAAAYENGQVVDSIGGGVCQIATTLYNASLEAEVEITQRQNHSMIVTYVKPSRDAAIAGTYKDIKIKNTYSTPIYVEGYTSGRKLTFTIYGKETRPENRKVEYVSETLGSTNPGEPQLIVDNSLAPGARVKVQSSHTGLRSRLWKVVTVDGVETERTMLSQDTYNASKAIYRVGPAAPAVVPAPAETAPVQPSQTQAPETAAPVTGENGGPGVTQAAPAEPAPAPAEAAPAAPAPAPAEPAPPAPASAEQPVISEVSQ